jgi:hypothetical protein
MIGWWLPVVAFAAMFCQDILGVVMVQSEAGNRARLAAAMDTAGDACTIASLWAVGDTLFVGGDWPLTVATVAARLLADWLGTYAGVKIWQRITGGVRVDPQDITPRA